MDDARKSRNAESLGWLAQSALPPKKQKLIEGVGVSSLLEMKAQLYRSQEEARHGRDGGLDPAERAAARRRPLDGLGGRNAGVHERDTADKLHIKSEGDRTAECYAALERKAALYEQLARGEVQYGSDEEERYNVDFLYKAVQPGEGGGAMGSGGAAPDSAAEAAYNTGGLVSDDMLRERERRSWEAEASGNHAAEQDREQERREKHELIFQLAEETEAGRERAAALKARRQAAQESKRERLKAAFLKKQLEKARAAKGRGAMGEGGAQRETAGS